VLGAILALTLLSPLLPDIDLDSALADLVVRVTDTGTWPQMLFVSIAILIMVISRAGLGSRRRTLETATISVIMLVFLAGNSQINEHIIKPVFAVPRPNIVALTEDGALGPEFPDAETFYAIGGKRDRREVLGEYLPALTDPALSDFVRAHWIHETGYSFPSGHATATVTLATLTVALALFWLSGWRRAVAVALLPIWAIAVVYSRTLLDVHTAGDVIAGTLIGFLWGLLGFAAVRWVVDRYSPGPLSG
jgi:phosphatidylglycerophosphatase B